MAVGTADGKVLFLNSKGELAGSYAAREYIRHIAMSSDGSVVVAASDERVYAFLPGPQLRVTPSPSRTGTVITTTPAPSLTGSPVPVLTVQPATTAIMTEVTEVPTTYSVIRTATQSPSALVTLFVSLALAMIIFVRRR